MSPVGYQRSLTTGNNGPLSGPVKRTDTVFCTKSNRDSSFAYFLKVSFYMIMIRWLFQALKVDWAPGKEVKAEYKEFWTKEHGVNYIPVDKVDNVVSLKSQGFVDMDSVPEEKRGSIS